MEEDWREEENAEVLRVREMLSQFCMGDEVAVKLAEDYLYVAHVLDDIYDQDKERSLREINESYMKAMGHIPLNPLYQTDVVMFASLSLMAGLTWQIANRLESGNADEKLGSFILRNGLLHLIYYIILKTGIMHGKPNWGIDIGELFWKEFFKGYHAKYLEFLDELKIKEEPKKPIPIKKRVRK